MKPNPFSYWSSTVEADGTIIIHNKEQEEADFLREQLKNNPNYKPNKIKSLQVKRDELQKEADEADKARAQEQLEEEHAGDDDWIREKQLREEQEQENLRAPKMNVFSIEDTQRIKDEEEMVH